MIRSLAELEERLKESRQRARLVLAAGEDVYALEAVVEASSRGIIEGVVTGESEKILKIAANNGLSVKDIEIIDCQSQVSAVEEAVKLVHNGSAHILMKGASTTAMLLKGVLNRDWGLRKGALLSHLAIFELESYHKLLAITDVAINISPSAEDKLNILNNAVGFLHSIGITLPKVALIAAVEKVYDSMPATIDAKWIVDQLTDQADAGCIVEGPLALDNAIDANSAKHKGIESAVAGDVDLLVMPQIESGNVLYKALAFLSKSKSASVVLGAAAPVVLTSRADSQDVKLNSIMLAAISYLQ